jgi:arylsulfatase A-like enzyme
MDRRDFLALGAGAMLGNGLNNSFAESKEKSGRKPNIIVIYTDDQGYADLGCQGHLPDLKTPNIDRLAAEGVRCTDGYITAPQCSPSRAGLLTGRYQQRFGLGHIPDCPLPKEEITIADRMKSAGYVTGMVGKWHLEPNALSKEWASTHLKKVENYGNGRVKVPFQAALPYYPQHRGFTEYFKGELKRYWANYDLAGKDLAAQGEWIKDGRYRLDVQSDAAVSFIERNHQSPFFLYLAYFAPHTPLEATEKYLKRFSGDMPERRRYALAMIAAMDAGVGRIMDTLAKHDLDEDTLIFFTSDNGAPLKRTMEDSPVTTDAGGWDGSRNDPLVGEKGMLSEGGIRVPFVARWKGTLPEGATYREPVSALDITATATALAGLPQAPELDGVNLLPHLTGTTKDAPHKALYWRFWNQTAIRKGRWKYLQAGGSGQFLFDLAQGPEEKGNVIEQHPEIAEELRNDLTQWASTLQKPGIPTGGLNIQEKQWYQHYFGLNT